MSILIAKNICKSYGTLNVLSEIDLTIEKGEILSIIGKSGAGKSTLLHIIGTLQKPDQGTLEINELAPFAFSNRRLSKFRNQNLGFVFQFHHLLEEFTAYENVILPATIHPNGVDNKRAEQLLEILGISERKNHKPSELSGGEQQRVAFARALINDPMIVFADEPTGNLDQETSDDIHNLILDLRKRLNQTFVIVTHNEELSGLSDRKLVMKDGKMID